MNKYWAESEASNEAGGTLVQYVYYAYSPRTFDERNKVIQYSSSIFVFVIKVGDSRDKESGESVVLMT